MVDTYLEVVKSFTRQLLDEPVLFLMTAELKSGMVLARDVLSEDGALFGGQGPRSRCRAHPPVAGRRSEIQKTI
ncbi:MAG: hypothetical protein MZV65_34715 [Chromatiales bacterium]|nr:hypothetical protein [Chromatiales bacterium]